MIFSLNRQAVKEFDLIHIRHIQKDGLGKNGIATGGNSGYQAVNLAYLLGANPIYMLGFDMKPKHGVNHWHGDHDRRGEHRLTNPNSNVYRQWIKNFSKMHREAQEVGVDIINCSRETALTIPRMSLEECLKT